MTKNENDENRGMSNDERNLFAINRFVWIDNTVFKIVSTDGIERIIVPDYYSKENTFQELKFNIIPEFDIE